MKYRIKIYNDGTCQVERAYWPHWVFEEPCYAQWYRKTEEEAKALIDSLIKRDEDYKISNIKEYP